MMIRVEVLPGANPKDVIPPHLDALWQGIEAPLVDAGVIEQSPEMRDELTTLRQMLQVLLHLVRRHCVHQCLHPEFRQQFPPISSSRHACVESLPHLDTRRIDGGSGVLGVIIATG